MEILSIFVSMPAIKVQQLLTALILRVQNFEDLWENFFLFMQ